MIIIIESPNLFLSLSPSLSSSIPLTLPQTSRQVEREGKDPKVNLTYQSWEEIDPSLKTPSFKSVHLPGERPL